MRIMHCTCCRDSLSVSLLLQYRQCDAARRDSCRVLVARNFIHLQGVFTPIKKHGENDPQIQARDGALQSRFIARLEQRGQIHKSVNMPNFTTDCLSINAQAKCMNVWCGNMSGAATRHIHTLKAYGVCIVDLEGLLILTTWLVKTRYERNKNKQNVLVVIINIHEYTPVTRMPDWHGRDIDQGTRAVESVISCHVHAAIITTCRHWKSPNAKTSSETTRPYCNTLDSPYTKHVTKYQSINNQPTLHCNT